MAQPFIFISTNTIKPGKLEPFRKSLQELVDVVEANEPRMIAFNLYVDESANQITGVQVHPDAASMQFHMQVVGDHIRSAYEYIEKTESVEIYGEVPAAMLEGVRQASPPGTPIRVVPAHEVGFTRSNATD